MPAGEELATIYSDSYKLGLLALRLLAGDHDTKNLQHIPSSAPAMLRQIITDTLSKPAQQRPLPEAWNYMLGNAIEQAQHQKKTAGVASAPPSTAPLPPPTPVVHSRPRPARRHPHPRHRGRLPNPGRRQLHGRPHHPNRRPRASYGPGSPSPPS